jgi:hypothetical protein
MSEPEPDDGFGFDETVQQEMGGDIVRPPPVVHNNNNNGRRWLSLTTAAMTSSSANGEEATAVANLQLQQQQAEETIEHLCFGDAILLYDADRSGFAFSAASGCVRACVKMGHGQPCLQARWIACIGTKKRGERREREREREERKHMVRNHEGRGEERTKGEYLSTLKEETKRAQHTPTHTYTYTHRERER